MTIERLISHIFEESDFAIELVDYPFISKPELLKTPVSKVGTEGESMIFGSSQTPGIENYCLAVFLQTVPTDLVTKHIPAYYTALRTHLGERLTPSMIRNFSLIVCLNREDGVSYDAQLLQIEEDPFDFKKYVLVYSQREVSELERAWELSGSGLIPFLNRFLYEDGAFSAYKQQMTPSTYGLVTRFFIKIPFLKLEVIERTFEDLQLVIRGHLGDELAGLRDQLLNASPEDILNKIREMETKPK